MKTNEEIQRLSGPARLKILAEYRNRVAQGETLTDDDFRDYLRVVRIERAARQASPYRRKTTASDKQEEQEEIELK